MFKFNDFLNLKLNDVVQELYIKFGKPETVYKIPIYKRISTEVKIFRIPFFKKVEIYSGLFQTILIFHKGFFNDYECMCRYNTKNELTDVIFLKNGDYHRLDGPAYISINNPDNNTFNINGKKYMDELTYLIKVEQFKQKEINFWKKLI